MNRPDKNGITLPEQESRQPGHDSGLVLLGDADLANEEDRYAQAQAELANQQLQAQAVAEHVEVRPVEPAQPVQTPHSTSVVTPAQDLEPESLFEDKAIAVERAAAESVVTERVAAERVAATSSQATKPKSVLRTQVKTDPEVSKQKAARSSGVRSTIEWLLVLVGAVVLAVVCRTFLFEGFSIPSASMEPTLQIGDRVMVNRVGTHFGGVDRGEVVVFDKPEGLQADNDHLIKRVVGLPGETIEGRDNYVYVNGQRLIEPYLASDVVIDDFGPTVVEEGQLFVMGDNRGRSQDSRFFGTIDEDLIVGKAFALYWPLGRFGRL